ncbi:pyruvate kinase [Nematocida minor]|uniref:pyruvate kinase n=1 Tax=Nematocida minor TaxID=1912983 RepID=UPI00221F0664|nr:pyruvate kinase [Nematocida minor]KAI5189914.1 pyruvate kinase [Nematocida minor]
MKCVAPTKIICTLGPSSNSEETIKKMIDAGMCIARINFSHGNGADQQDTFDVLNRIRNSDAYSSLAIAIDTKGPEIRTGVFEEEVYVEKGDRVVLTTDTQYKSVCNKNKIFIDHAGVYDDLNSSTKNIYIDDGKIDLEIVEVSKEKQEILTCVKTPGKISSHKGVNIPNAKLSLPSISEKDRADILFGVEHGANFIFASFIREKENIKEIREIVNNTEIKIIAKIESQQGIDNIAEIVKEADGIMIARGDLGIEVEYSRLFSIQCKISKECRAQGKPFIVATQILESMTDSTRPTRAEITDLSFAVLSGAGCVMLSGETAAGKYPVETVQAMQKVITEVSKSTVFPSDQNYSGLIVIPPANTINVFISNNKTNVRSMQIVFGCYPVHTSAYEKKNLLVPEGYTIREDRSE